MEENTFNNPFERDASDWVFLKTTIENLTQEDLLALDNRIKQPDNAKLIILGFEHNVTTRKTIVKYKLRRTFYSQLNMDEYLKEINQAQENLNKAMAQFINSHGYQKIIEALKNVGAFG